MIFKNQSLNLNYLLSISPLTNEISCDPTLSLLKDNQEFDLVLNSETNSDKYIEYIYYNRKNICDILFDLESNINIERIINKDINNQKLESFLYYLCLLIEENKDIVYFIYPYEFIKKMSVNFISEDKENKNDQNICAKIILSKILIELINNFISENYMNRNRDLGIIENDIEKIIQKDIEKLKEINLVLTKEEIITKNLDDIYFDIIKSILNLECRDKYDKALNIFTQMNLDIINILNNNIYHKMKKALNERNFKRKYLIQNIDDFHNQNKIDIYFILLKFIFKSSLYIYQIPFLYEARNVLLKNLRKNNQQIFNNEINNLNYVIERLLDSDYYLDKYLKITKKDEIVKPDKEIIKEIKDKEYDNTKDKINKNKIDDDINNVLIYYKNYKFDSKKEDITKIETSLRNNENIDFNEYLKDLDEAKYLNPRFSLIKFFYYYSNKNKPLTENSLQQEVNSFKKQEKILTDTNFNKMTSCKTFYEYFKNPENTEQVINIYTKNLYDSFMTFNKLKEVLFYYKHFFFESKAQEIKTLDKITKNKSFNDEKIPIYLNEFEIAEKMNLRHSIIHKLSKVGIKENNPTEERINEITYKWNNYIEQSIHNKSTNYSNLDKPLLYELTEYFKNKSKEENLLKIFSIDTIEFFRNLEFEKDEMIIQEEKEDKNEEIIIEDKKVEISNDSIKKSEINNESSFIDVNKSKEINIDDLSVLEETSFKTKVFTYINKNKENVDLSQYNDDEKLLIFEIFAEKNIDEISPAKIEEIKKKYSTMKGGIKNRKKNKLSKNLVNEAYNYFSEIKNKEKLLKTFTEEDINFLLTLKESKNKKQINQLEPEKINQLEEVKKYYNNFYPEKEGDIKNIERIIKEKNKNDEKINEYLNEYEKAEKLNRRYPLILFLFKIRQKDRGVKTISEVIESWNNTEKTIKEGKYRKVREKNNLKEYFKKEENKKNTLQSQIFTEEQLNNFLNAINNSINNSKIKEEKIKPAEKLSIEIINNLEIILNYYKNYYFESKKEEIDMLEKNIKLGEKFEYKKYLNDLEVAISRNERYPIIKFICEKNNKGKEINEKEMLEWLKNFESNENSLRDGKKKKIKRQIKMPIIEYFNNKENMPILLKIFTPEQINNYIEKKEQKEEKEQKEQKEQKISKEIINELKEILDYYNNYFFESKAKEISELNDIIKNQQGNYEKYLKEKEAKAMNIRYPLVCIIYEKNNDINNKNEEKFTESKNSWKKYEDMIRRKKFSKLPLSIGETLFKYFNDENNKNRFETLFKYFNDENNKNRLLEIFKEDEYQYFKDEKNHPKKKKKKISEENLNKLKIVLNYYNNYEFQSKKDDINILENGIKKGEEFDYKKYLEKLKEYEDMNIKYPIIEFLLLKNNKEKTEEELQKILKSYNEAEKLIKDKKKKKFPQKIKKHLLEYFNNINNREILIKIFEKDQIDNFLKNEKLSDEIINQLKEVLDYYNNYFFETKKQEIKDLNEIIKNQQGDYEKYLNEKEAKTMNIRYPLIYKIYENNNDTNNKNEKKFTESKNSWKKYEDMIRRKKFSKLPLSIEKNHPKKKKEKISEENLKKLNIVLNYYKNYLFNSMKNEIEILEKGIDKGEEFEFKEYLNLKNFEEMKNANERFPIIEFLFSKEKNKEKTEEELKKILKSYNEAEKLIKDKKVKKFPQKIKKHLLEYFNNINNREILIKIFEKDEIDNFLKTSKISDENINKLKEILNYYNNYLFISKSKEISELNEIIKNGYGNFEKYLNEYEKAKNINIRYPLICLINDNNTIEKNEEILGKKIDTWNKFETMINEKKTFKKMPQDIKKKLYDYFNNEENKDILMKIFEKDILENCKKELEHQINKKKITKEEIEKLTIVLNYYKNYLFESKKEDIIIIEKAIKKKNVDYEKFLNDLDISKAMNEKYPIIEYLSNAIDNKNIKERTEEEIKLILDTFEKFEKIIREKSKEKIQPDLEKIENSLFIFFKDEKNKDILLKLFTEEEINNFLDRETINELNIYKLEIILKYYQNYFFESKINEIENLKEIINNKKGSYEKYLPELDTAEYLNNRYPLINCFIEEKDKKSEHKFSEAIEQWKENEKIINSKKSLNEMKNKEVLFNYLLQDDNNQNILSEIFEKDVVDNLLKILKEYKNNNEIKNKLKEVL